MPFIAKTLQNLGEKHSMVVHGADGSDEITNTGITYISRSFPRPHPELHDHAGTVRSPRLHARGPSGRHARGERADLLDLLQGQKGAHRDIVVLNAAATIYIGQKASSLEEAVRIAAETIDSGKAFAKLEEIRAYTNRDDIKSL